jgi:hypothetical protein
MITTNKLKKMLVGTLLSGGVALAGFGLTAGTAYASPENPGPSIDYPDSGGTLVQCKQCGRGLPGALDTPAVNPATKIHVAVQGTR